jgi:hypothetical protein
LLHEVERRAIFATTNGIINFQKSSAHQKAVLQQREKAKEKRMKVCLKQIKQDKSVSKQCLHIHLLALVNKLGEKGLVRKNQPITTRDYVTTKHFLPNTLCTTSTTRTQQLPRPNPTPITDDKKR